MPSQKNIDQLAILIEKFESAKSVIWTTYASISVSDQTELRYNVVEAGGEFTVSKNNLMHGSGT